MSRQTNVARAAVLAGLIAGGGVYAAGHRVSDPAITASASARATLAGVHPVVRHGGLLRWHPPKMPKTPKTPTAPAPAQGLAIAATSQAVPAPVVAASAPTTQTSPAGSGDDGTEAEAGGDD